MDCYLEKLLSFYKTLLVKLHSACLNGFFSEIFSVVWGCLLRTLTLSYTGIDTSVLKIIALQVVLTVPASPD